MRRIFRPLKIMLCLLLVSSFSISPARADFPDRTIRIIVPFPAGGSADVRARQLAEIISKNIKHQVIVDNRPGAAGNIGTSLAAKSQPDGYTVLFTFTTSMAVNPHLYKDPGYQPLKDFVHFIIMLKGVAMLAVKAESPFQSVRDLLAFAQSNPSKLNYGTAGPGSIQHLMGERLERIAGLKMVAIPYKGEAPLLADLMGGQIDIAFGFPLAVMPYVTGGKLRVLAVSSAKRLPPYSDIPTLSEAGVAGYDESAWGGFAVPVGTPAAVVRKLHEIFRAAMTSPEFRREVERSGGEVVASSQEYAAQLVHSDYERYGRVLKELNIRLE